MSRAILALSAAGLFVVTLALLLLAAGGSAAAKPASHASGALRQSPLANPIFGADVQVNPTSTAYLFLQRNLGLSIDSADPSRVLASYDANEQNASFPAYALSTDAGRTWAGGRFDRPWRDTGLVPVLTGNAVFDSAGTAYYAGLAVTSTLSGIYLLTSTDGLNWGEPAPIAEAPYSEGYRAEPYMTVDARATGAYAGSLYAFWIYTTYQWEGIRMRYSRDHGTTWSSDIQVSDSGHEQAYGPLPVVASDGSIYVSFEQTNDPGPAGTFRLYLDRSTDGGATWGTDRLISGAPITKTGGGDFEGGRELVLPSSNDCNNALIMRQYHYPSIAVSPVNPLEVYAAWNDGRWQQGYSYCGSSGLHSDVAFSRTTDGGLTWSAPIRLNDDEQGNGRDHFQPTIAVRTDGTIGATWYDERYDVANTFMYDHVYSQSADGGLTWTPNGRVSDSSYDPNSAPDFEGVGDLGYRKALVFGADYALPAWVGTEREIFITHYLVDRGSLPAATATPTPVSTATSPPTVTPPPTVTTSPATATPAPPTPCGLTFSDVPPENAFHSYVRCLACRGIISGYSDGTFRPNNNITRGQIAKIVSNAAAFADPIPPDAQTYTDVSPDNPFWQWVERLAIHRVMSGYDCGAPGEPCDPQNRPYFRWANNATRAQLAKIDSNAAGYSEDPGGQFFADVPPGHAFYPWVQRLADRNIMGGYNCGGPGEPCDPQNRPYFRPYNSVTRGQASKIVANTFYPDCQTPTR